MRTLLLVLFVLPLMAFGRDAGPREKLESFYKSYLAYIDASFSKKPMKLKQAHYEERKKIDNYFSARYRKEIAARDKKCAETKELTEECDGNFFYCAQEPPTSFEVKETKVDGKRAAGLISLCFNCGQKAEEKRIVRAALVQEKKGWKIDSIKCPGGKE